MYLQSSCFRLGFIGSRLSIRWYAQLRTGIDKGLLDRTTERQHRTAYNTIDKEMRSYNKKNVVIKPKIRDLLIQAQMDNERREYSLSETALPNPFNMKQLLEPITFHSILVLRNRESGHDSNGKLQVQKQYDSQKAFLMTVIKKVSGTTEIGSLRKTVEKQCTLSIREQCELLFARYIGNEFTKSDEISEVLELCVLTFNILSERAFQGRYTVENDLSHWISSITAPSVTAACDSLKVLSTLPAFVASDILLRTPHSKQEYFLQLDIWSQFINEISIAYHKSISHLKSCISNIIFYGIQLDSSKLPHVISSTFNSLMSSETGYSFKVINEDYINELLWQTAFDSLRSISENDIKRANNILATQKVMVSFMSKIGSYSKKPFEMLQLKGQMGIIVTINIISNEKANKLLSITEKKHGNDIHSKNNKELIPYSIARVLLASTPDQLIHNFNVIAAENIHSSALWLCFIRKLFIFGLLTPKRSREVVKVLIKNVNKVLISRDIVNILLRPIKSHRALNDFVRILSQGNFNLAVYSNTILSKYLVLLYSTAELHSDKYWHKNIDLGLIHKFNKSLKQHTDFTSAADYARYIYENAFKRKTVTLIGIMLSGEVQFQPQNIFNLMEIELGRIGSPLPNEQCLSALIKAAMIMNNDTTIRTSYWNGMFPSQVVVNKFKSFVMEKDYDNSFKKIEEDCKIYPSDKLWESYILMLNSFGYVSELAVIVRWWEELNFTPSSVSLLSLLRALPRDHSERLIKHINKVKSDNLALNVKGGKNTQSTILDWPWPSMEKL